MWDDEYERGTRVTFPEGERRLGRGGGWTAGGVVRFWYITLGVGIPLKCDVNKVNKMKGDAGLFEFGDGVTLRAIGFVEPCLGGSHDARVGRWSKILTH